MVNVINLLIGDKKRRKKYVDNAVNDFFSRHEDIVGAEKKAIEEELRKKLDIESERGKIISKSSIQERIVRALMVFGTALLLGFIFGAPFLPLLLGAFVAFGIVMVTNPLAQANREEAGVKSGLLAFEGDLDKKRTEIARKQESENKKSEEKTQETYNWREKAGGQRRMQQEFGLA